MRGIVLTTATLMAVTITLWAGSVPAGAQPDDSNISFSAPGLLPKKPKPGLPDVRPQPLAWPRLDAGAVMCRSEDDLNRLAQRRMGERAEGAVDCQIIRAPTPVTIIQRRGPGRTEVKATGSQDTASGWTDAWLPEKAPSSARSAAR